MLQARSIHAGLALIAIAFTSVQAQAPTPVSWAARAHDVSALTPGTEAKITLIATVEPGWHIYSLTQKPGGPIAMRVSIPSGEPFVLAGDVRGPKPAVQSDPSLDVPVELYSGVAEFTVPLKLTTSSSGTLEGRITVRHQVCSDTTCLPPRSVTVPVRLQPRKDGSPR